jgi:hypothetical protein
VAMDIEEDSVGSDAKGLLISLLVHHSAYLLTRSRSVYRGSHRCSIVHLPTRRHIKLPSSQALLRSIRITFRATHRLGISHSAASPSRNNHISPSQEHPEAASSLGLAISRLLAISQSIWLVLPNSPPFSSSAQTLGQIFLLPSPSGGTSATSPRLGTNPSHSLAASSFPFPSSSENVRRARRHRQGRRQRFDAEAGTPEGS